MADEAIYRCINEACGRPAPRPVNYCPWCGTAQARAGAQVPGAKAPAAAVPGATATPVPAAATAAAAGASAAAVQSGWSDAPLPPGAAAAPPGAAPSATEFGRTGKGAAASPAAAPAAASPADAGQAPPPQEVPRPPLAARPPQRKPIRLRWWLLALVLLWAIWVVAKPSARKIERRIDAAIALAHQCKGSEAQAELIALRQSSATPEQLQRLQQSLNDEAAVCTTRRQRAKAWTEASVAVDTALAAGSWDKAKTRLQAFIRRWGEDDRTRALQVRIEDARREDEARRAHPLAVPPAPAPQREGMIQ